MEKCIILGSIWIRKLFRQQSTEFRDNLQSYLWYFPSGPIAHMHCRFSTQTSTVPLSSAPLHGLQEWQILASLLELSTDIGWTDRTSIDRSSWFFKWKGLDFICCNTWYWYWLHLPLTKCSKFTLFSKIGPKFTLFIKIDPKFTFLRK